MSTVIDPGRPAGTNARCPAWCELPDDHDLPVIPVATGSSAPARREHIVTLIDDLTLGHVAAVRVDAVICPTGPELVGAVLVEVNDIPTPLDRTQFADLVDALVRAQGAVAELYGADVQRRPDIDYGPSADEIAGGPR